MHPLVSWRRWLLLACVSTLGGCASLSKSECLRGDWQTLGYQDGRAGKSTERLSAYTEDCSEHGVQPDPLAYGAGFKAGIREYCTTERGLAEGERQNEYSGACPADLETAFLDGYVRGLTLARDNLALEYQYLTLELDVWRDKRSLFDDEARSEEIDDELDMLETRLSANLRQRQAINEKLAQWNRQL